MHRSWPLSGSGPCAASGDATLASIISDITTVLQREFGDLFGVVSSLPVTDRRRRKRPTGGGGSVVAAHGFAAGPISAGIRELPRRQKVAPTSGNKSAHGHPIDLGAFRASFFVIGRESPHYPMLGWLLASVSPPTGRRRLDTGATRINATSRPSG
jgi:hypothetical protein